MNKKIITLIIAIAAVCGRANAQWKQGDVPPSSRRGKIPPTEIDKADVTVYYAFNASDIKDESTYIDLGWLQVGKQYTKYASYFVAHSDSTYKPVLIKNSNGESGYAGRKFGGLPGLIMKIYDTRHLYTWEAVSVENGSFPIYQLEERFFKDSDRKKVLKMQRDWNVKYNELSGRMYNGTMQVRTERYPFEQLELE